MADISKITVENTTYFVKDTVARGHGCFVTTDAPTNVSGQYVWSKASLKPYSVDPQGIIEYKNHYYEIQPDQSTSTSVTAYYVTSLPAPPSGGSTGQVLAKASATDYDFEWVNQSGGGAVTTWYGTSSTAAGTQTKVVACADFVLEKGAIVTVYFSTANTYGAIKLNVNSTGAISVYHRGTATSASNVVSWNKKEYVTFQYNGTYWVFIASSGSRVISSKDRLTSANVATNGTGELNHLVCKATTMTTGTPASDGHIIDLDWDANYSQHAQLFLPCVDNQFPQWRMQVNNAWTAWDTFYTVANPPSGCSLAWNQVAQTTNNTAAALDLTGYSEVLIVADALRNSAHHFFSVNVPIQAIGSTAAEYKLGGYVGANASTSGGAWCSMNLTSFNGVQLFINNTSFLSSTTWTVYAR